MTPDQRNAVWELQLQGLQEAADQAERAWKDGQFFEPPARVPLSRRISHLIKMANWEARPIAV